LTPADLHVEATDAPDALSALLKRHPMADAAVRDWAPEVDAFAVLLRGWMEANVNMTLELTLRKHNYADGGCIFTTRRPEKLPTDFLVETISSVTRVNDERQTVGLAGALWAFFSKIYVIGGQESERQVQVLLTPHSLIIGGRLIWQQ
jgi:hypothetical protein